MGKTATIKKEDTDKSQEPFDYNKIQQLNEKAWANPQVQKNWKEFYQRERKRQEKEKAEKQNGKSIDKSQEPFDYNKIQQLNEKAWANPQVQKNWKEFYQRERKRQEKEKVNQSFQ